MKKRLTWAGGTRPNGLMSLSTDAFHALIVWHREDVDAYKAFWGKYPDHETASTIYHDAMMDAWATYHQQEG